jgi:hypothetical protein
MQQIAKLTEEHLNIKNTQVFVKWIWSHHTYKS